MFDTIKFSYVVIEIDIIDDGFRKSVNLTKTYEKWILK